MPPLRMPGSGPAHLAEIPAVIDHALEHDPWHLLNPTGDDHQVDRQRLEDVAEPAVQHRRGLGRKQAEVDEVARVERVGCPGVPKNALVEQAEDVYCTSQNTGREIEIEESLLLGYLQLDEKILLNLINLVQQTGSCMKLATAMHFNQAPDMSLALLDQLDITIICLCPQDRCALRPDFGK